jgi:hypothetical protein
MLGLLICIQHVLLSHLRLNLYIKLQNGNVGSKAGIRKIISLREDLAGSVHVSSVIAIRRKRISGRIHPGS